MVNRYPRAFKVWLCQRAGESRLHGTLTTEGTDLNCGHCMHHKEDRAVKYTNQYGESIPIAQTDEVWLNDDFFAREMAKLPPDAPRAGLAYRVSTLGQVDHDDIPCKRSSAGNSAPSMAGA